MKVDELITDLPTMTVEEYIAFEEQSETRHEYINQRLIPIPGTTRIHNTICFLIRSLLTHLLQDSKYCIYSENVKVQILSERDYTYPDVVITNDTRDTDDTNQYFIKYPSVIFEVMSKNSRIDDKADKFLRYKQIETLQNYILVDSEKAYVEVRYKTSEGAWESNTYLASDGKFSVPALGVELTFEDVYQGVKF